MLSSRSRNRSGGSPQEYNARVSWNYLTCSCGLNLPVDTRHLNDELPYTPCACDICGSSGRPEACYAQPLARGRQHDSTTRHIRRCPRVSTERAFQSLTVDFFTRQLGSCNWPIPSGHYHAKPRCERDQRTDLRARGIFLQSRSASS